MVSPGDPIGLSAPDPPSSMVPATENPIVYVFAGTAFASWIAARNVHSPPEVAHVPLPGLASTPSVNVLTVKVTDAACAGTAAARASVPLPTTTATTPTAHLVIHRIALSLRALDHRSIPRPLDRCHRFRGHAIARPTSSAGAVAIGPASGRQRPHVARPARPDEEP